MNDDNNQNNNQNQQGSAAADAAAADLDPYAVLNVSSGAPIEEIQKSYKLLSRSFHPDKQQQSISGSTSTPTSTQADAKAEAQQYFVQLKGAYDILMDPVYKFALDHFGYDGVSFLRRRTKLYQKISLLLQKRQKIERGIGMGGPSRKSGSSSSSSSNSKINIYNNGIEQKAKYILSEAMQYHNYQMVSMIKLQKPKISGSVRVKCNTTHSHFLGEGMEPLTLDVDSTRIDLSISDPIAITNTSTNTGAGAGGGQQQHHRSRKKNKVGVTCTASSSLKTTSGEGGTSGQLSFQYEPVQNTELFANVSSEINMFHGVQGEEQQKQIQKQSHDPKVMFGSSRIMSNNIYVSANLSAPLKSMFHLFNLNFITNKLHTNKATRTTTTTTTATTGGQKQELESGAEDQKEEEIQSNNNNHNNDWVVALTTHRSLFRDRVNCTWIAGIALPITGMQYGMFSISTNNNKAQHEDDQNDEDDHDTDEEGGDSDDDSNNRGSHNSNKKENQRQQKRKSRKSQKDWYWFKNKNPAKHTLKLNIGMNHTPLQFTSEKPISERHLAKVSLGYGPYGSDVKLLSIRTLSNFCNLTLGVGHSAYGAGGLGNGGLSTYFRIERGNIHFTVPVYVSSAMSPAYAMKSMYVTLFMSLVDQVVGDIMNGDDDNNNEDYLDVTDDNNGGDNILQSRRTTRITNSHEDMLLEREKKKRDRLQQIELMRKSAEAKMKKEALKMKRKKKGDDENGGGGEGEGLVILKATYEVYGGDSIDVTIALQFWVMNSSLHLPSMMSKSSMLGFYDVRNNDVEEELSLGLGLGSGAFWQAWRKVLSERFSSFFTAVSNVSRRKVQHESLLELSSNNNNSNIPTLTVRYRYGGNGNVYEITVYDHEELSLPSPKAMRLGGAYVN